MAEAEIRADPDFARSQASNQQLAHEFLRTHGRERRIEAQQADAVGAQGTQTLVLSARQGQARRRQVAGKEFARQRLEAQRHRRQCQIAGTRNGVAHQRPMAQVQTVEGADADHATVREQRPTIDVTKQPAHYHEV
jgi:hypothetical protein